MTVSRIFCSRDFSQNSLSQPTLNSTDNLNLEQPGTSSKHPARLSQLVRGELWADRSGEVNLLRVRGTPICCRAKCNPNRQPGLDSGRDCRHLQVRVLCGVAFSLDKGPSSGANLSRVRESLIPGYLRTKRRSPAPIINLSFYDF